MNSDLKLTLASLISNRHHGLPVNVYLEEFLPGHWDGILRDPYVPSKQISRRVLQKLSGDELLLALNGHYLEIHLAQGGIVSSAVPIEPPSWLYDPMRFMDEAEPDV